MKIIAITGPAGSGKSTVGERLAKELGNCVNIDADHIKHMIVSGFTFEITPDGGKKIDYNQWELVGESIGLLAKNFQDKAFDVVINGYINEPAWENIEKQVVITHKFLLLPSLETTKNRDKQRLGDQPMGDGIVTKHHSYFSSTNFYKDFKRIDSTNDAVDETVDRILWFLRAR